MLIDINTIELPFDLKKVYEEALEGKDDDDDDDVVEPVFVMTFNNTEKHLMKMKGFNAAIPGRVLLEFVKKI